MHTKLMPFIAFFRLSMLQLAGAMSIVVWGMVMCVRQDVLSLHLVTVVLISLMPVIVVSSLSLKVYVQA